MNLGEKLKQLRRLRGVTQKELAGNFLTRNMLSQIERGVAMPSYATIALLSKKLRVDPSYFFESSFSLEHYEILSALPQIKRCFSKGQFSLCLRLAEPFREIDSDELLWILSSASYHLGLDNFNHNDFEGAFFHFDCSLNYGRSCSLGSPYARQIEFYQSLMRHLQCGADFSLPSLLRGISDDPAFADYVSYIYLNGLLDNGQTEKASQLYDALRISDLNLRSHFNARLAASLLNFQRAKELLQQIILSKEDLPFPFLYADYFLSFPRRKNPDLTAPNDRLYSPGRLCLSYILWGVNVCHWEIRPCCCEIRGKGRRCASTVPRRSRPPRSARISRWAL